MQNAAGMLLPVEVGDDDGDGQGDAENTTDGAQRPDQLASSRRWRNVAISCAPELIFPVIRAQFCFHCVFNIPCPFSPPSSNDA